MWGDAVQSVRRRRDPGRPGPIPRRPVRQPRNSHPRAWKPSSTTASSSQVSKPLPTVVINILVVRHRPGIRFKIVQFPGQRPARGGNRDQQREGWRDEQPTSPACWGARALASCLRMRTCRKIDGRSILAEGRSDHRPPLGRHVVATGRKIRRDLRAPRWMPGVTAGSPDVMATGPGDKPARPVAPGVKEAAPGGTLPAGQDEMLPPDAPAGTGRPEKDAAGRVRRPADLLFAVLSLAVVAVVVGSIRALPLGSTELADDVSAWLHHIPALAVVRGRGGVRRRLFRPGGRRPGGADTRPVAGRAQRGRRGWSPAPRRPWPRRPCGGPRTARSSMPCCTAAIPSIFVVDTAFVAFVVGTDLTRRSHWSRWWPCAVAALLISGLAVGRPDAVRRGDRVLRRGARPDGWCAGCSARRRSCPARPNSWPGSGVRARQSATLAGDRRARLDGTLNDGTRDPGAPVRP